jgi:hypothetical protein
MLRMLTCKTMWRRRLRAAVRGRVSDEEAPAGEILNIDCYSMNVEVHMRIDDEEEDDTPLSV